MPTKSGVLEQLGETALILPDRINRALAANDRIKYFMTVLQAARDHAAHPDTASSPLQTEREASGVDDVSLDAVVAGSTHEDEHALHIPQASVIHQFRVRQNPPVNRLVQVHHPVVSSMVALNGRSRCSRVFGSKLFTDCSLLPNHAHCASRRGDGSSEAPRLSHRQAEFAGGLFLRAVQRDEPINPFGRMEPER